jgi:hypothetical protein
MMKARNILKVLSRKKRRTGSWIVWIAIYMNFDLSRVYIDRKARPAGLYCQHMMG